MKFTYSMFGCELDEVCLTLASKTCQETDRTESETSVADFLQILGWIHLFVVAQTSI